MPKLKLLVAEDSKSTMALYQQVLSEILFEKRFAVDGAEALDIYKEWHPDIILLDFMMPNVNGFQALQTIRKKLDDTTTTIIMITSMTDKNEIVACAKMGIQGYIVKPFTSGTLNETIVKYHKANTAGCSPKP